MIDIKTIKTESFEMDYFTFGEGERAFVIIPGLSVRSVMFSAPSICGAYSEFGQKYKCYVFGPVKKPDEKTTIKSMADCLASAMKILKIQGAFIFGASQGGMIAQCIAIDYPCLVSKLVIGSSMSRNNETSTKVLECWAGFAESGEVEKLNRSIFNSIYSDEFLSQYQKAFELLVKIGNDDELKSFAYSVRACLSFDIYSQLEKIKCPVLVLGGKKDAVLSSEASAEIAEKLRCEIYMYDNGSHAVYDEADDYKERLLDFFGK